MTFNENNHVSDASLIHKYIVRLHEYKIDKKARK